MFSNLFGMLRCSESTEVIETQPYSSQEKKIPMYIAVELAHNPENVPEVVQMLGQMNISISKIDMPAQLTCRFFALNKDFDHIHNLYSFFSAHRILS
ncbi:hypothetical protein M153_14100015724 [Pseudoloma neurophilia]|uniref:Uncharacterized protein n=1 Tax=Pseudoloma neurophilia TaxID=146866 RepID=A0A0R0M6R4_9MICR|nr:hypothetical protein M153_14100015724 [Pseudoloma neurophilia]